MLIAGAMCAAPPTLPPGYPSTMVVDNIKNSRNKKKKKKNQ
jgi:hypothetical protein